MTLSKHQIESLPARPVFAAVNLDVIPRTLREHVQWVLWKYDWHADRECWTKVPYSFRDNPSGKGGRLIHSKSTARELWMGWAQALDRRARMDGRGGNQLGIGFVLAEGGGIVCIDLDDCRNRDTGEITPSAMAIISEFDTYTEVSPSGTGVKLFLRGSKTCNRSKNVEREIEVYESKRFVAMTGHLLPGLPAEPMPRQEQLDKLTRELFPTEYEPRPLRGASRHDVAPGAAPAPNLSALSLSDADIIERASNASNGMKFRSLWAGDDSAHNGDRSSADLALACMLAFWVGPDASRIESLMRQSGLVRAKWDRADYMRRTIARALSGRGSYFGDRSAKWQELEEELASTPPLPKGWFAASLELMRAKKREREEAERKTQIEAASQFLAATPEEIAQRHREEAAREIAESRASMHAAQYRCTKITRIALMDLLTHEPRVVSVRCQKPDCCGCRRWLILREMTSARCHLGSAAGLFEFGCDDADWVMMRKRIKRARGQYLRCREGLGWYVVTDVQVEGAIAVQQQVALGTLGTLLEEWGDSRPVSTSRGWKLPTEPKEDKYERVGVVAPSTTLRDIMDAASLHNASVQAGGGGRGDATGRMLACVRLIRDAAWTHDEAFAALAELCHRDPPQDGWRALPLCPGVTGTVYEAMGINDLATV